MKPININSSSYAEYCVDLSKFNIGDHVKISKHKSIFAKSYAPNWTQEVFMITVNTHY